ncbi:MAG: BA14K family protein [Rhizobiales bacterium]|nr:BA14K family protein [Hyphomicrobiales bacterium]MBI3671870.1 BA14K family protein [Hyphomicrobiales bacterium]
MSRIVSLLFAAVLVAVPIAARADVASYCQAYARDEGDAALVGNAIISGKQTGPLSGPDWEARVKAALADCLAQYGATPQSEAQPVTGATPTVESEKAPAAKPAAKAKPAPQKKAGQARIRSVSPIQGGPPSYAEPAPGSAEWNAYCSKKYASFDPATGTYKSLTGKIRPCVYTKR